MPIAAWVVTAVSAILASLGSLLVAIGLSMVAPSVGDMPDAAQFPALIIGFVAYVVLWWAMFNFFCDILDGPRR